MSHKDIFIQFESLNGVSGYRRLLNKDPIWIRINNTSSQCWALAPLLAPPHHWRELKKLVRWQWREKNGANSHLYRAIFEPNFA